MNWVFKYISLLFVIKGLMRPNQTIEEAGAPVLNTQGDKGAGVLQTLRAQQHCICLYPGTRRYRKIGLICRRVRIIAKRNCLPRHVSFHVILYLNIFRKSVEKIQVSLKSTRITGNIHEDQYTFFIIFRSILLRMKFQILFNKHFSKILPFMR
jgi:hypothetical protein